MITRKTPAFTLAELLVVMALIAILATLSTIYLFGNFEDSRDAVRMSDIQTIWKNLDVYFTQNGEYVTPDSPVDVVHEWQVVWSQWIFSAWATRTLWVFGAEIPEDPEYWNHYSYSITNKWREYQIAWILEWEIEEEGLWEEIVGLFVDTAHASIERAYVYGKYNNFMIMTSSGGINTFIASPSIIANDLSSTGAVDIITQRKLVYDDFFNLPSSYSTFLATDGWFWFNVTDPIIFSWSLTELKTADGLQWFSDKMSYIYATTPTESFDTYRNILESDNKNSKLKDFLKKHYNITFKIAFDCRDIYDSGVWRKSGDYEIDPDGDGPLPKQTVYCDMETGWGWWTKRNIINFSNGEFDWWWNISSEYSSVGTNTIVNLWAANTPVASWYALHQTGWADSEYQIHFEDQDPGTPWYQVPNLQAGDEIRMYAWIRDDDWATSWSSCWTDDESICQQVPSAGYAFHNKLYLAGWLNDVNGITETIETTTTADGKVWNHQRLTKTLRSNTIWFDWSLWYGFEWNPTDFYATGIRLEVYYWWHQ